MGKRSNKKKKRKRKIQQQNIQKQRQPAPLKRKQVNSAIKRIKSAKDDKFLSIILMIPIIVLFVVDIFVAIAMDVFKYKSIHAEIESNMLSVASLILAIYSVPLLKKA